MLLLDFPIPNTYGIVTQITSALVFLGVILFWFLCCLAAIMKPAWGVWFRRALLLTTTACFVAGHCFYFYYYQVFLRQELSDSVVLNHKMTLFSLREAFELVTLTGLALLLVLVPVDLVLMLVRSKRKLTEKHPSNVSCC